MNKTKPIFLFATLFVLLSATTMTATADPSVQPLKESDIEYGCGCSFHVPFSAGVNGSMVLQWEADSLATLRVDGHAVKLKVDQQPNPIAQQRPEAIGDKTVFILTGGETKVKVSCVAIRVCKPEDESCEVTLYRSRISVTTAKGTKFLNAWGNCGC